MSGCYSKRKNIIAIKKILYIIFNVIAKEKQWRVAQ